MDDFDENDDFFSQLPIDKELFKKPLDVVHDKTKQQLNNSKINSSNNSLPTSSKTFIKKNVYQLNNLQFKSNNQSTIKSNQLKSNVNKNQSVNTNIIIGSVIKDLNEPENSFSVNFKHEIDPKDEMDFYKGKISTLESLLEKKNNEYNTLNNKLKEFNETFEKYKKDSAKEIEILKTRQEFSENEARSIRHRAILYSSKKEPIKNEKKNQTLLNDYSSIKNKPTIINETTNENKIIPETLINITDIDFNSQNKSQSDESVIPPTINDQENIRQFDLKLQDTDLNNDSDLDDFVPPTQVTNKNDKIKEINIDFLCLDESLNDDTSRNKKIKTNQNNENEIQNNLQVKPYVKHVNFDYIKYSVYETIFSNEFNLYNEGINHNFDIILKKCFSTNFCETIKNFELSFNNINEELILTLLYEFDIRSNIPELTLKMLTETSAKEIVYKISNKCLILNLEDKYINNKTLLNKILEILTSNKNGQNLTSTEYLSFCYFIFIFLNKYTAEDNNITKFHNFDCSCWKEVYESSSHFAIYLMNIYDSNNKLHTFLVIELITFFQSLKQINLNFKDFSSTSRFRCFAMEMTSKIDEKYSNFLKFIDTT